MSAAASNATAPERLYRIGDVSRLTDTKPFVLRFWETEFPMLQPVKTPKGHRLYRQEDIDLILAIKGLLYEEGFTIAGARRHLAEALGSGGREAPPGQAMGEGRGITPQRERAPAVHVDAPNEGVPAAAMTGDARSTLLAVRQELRAILTLLGTR